MDEYKGLAFAVTLQQLAVKASGRASKDAVVAVVGRIFQADVSDANSVIDRVVEFGKQQAMINAIAVRGGETAADRGPQHIQSDPARRRWWGKTH